MPLNRSSMLARSTTDDGEPDKPGRGRKNVLVRMDPAVYEALALWAADELRSTTAQIELVLRRALQDAGRLPSQVGAMPRRGRPRQM